MGVGVGVGVRVWVWVCAARRERVEDAGQVQNKQIHTFINTGRFL